MLNVGLLAIGVALLTIGGEALIRGSMAAARQLGISPLLSGLLIVGFGTSAPELVVSVDAALNIRPDIALGNVVGSNIGNILLILGLCALISPMVVKPQVLRRDAVAVVLASVLFIVLLDDTALGTQDAAILLSALGGYLVWAYWSERKHAAPPADLHRAEAELLVNLPNSVPWTVLAIAAGLLMLVGGSQVLLIGAVSIAKQAGVSEAAIGLTLVAIGTSLPELSVSLVAALRGHADVAVGNVLGSNLFNLLGILGVSALFQPLPVHSRLMQFDQWVLVGTSFALLLFLHTGRRLNRMEGTSLLLAYIAYVALNFTVFAD